MGRSDAADHRRRRQADHGAGPAPDATLARREHGLDVVVRGALLACLVAGPLLPGCGEDGEDLTAEFVQRADSRLVKVQSVGLAALGPINPHTAEPAHAAAAFGAPTSAIQRRSVCARRWADLGLTIRFAAREGEDPCGSRASIERITLADPDAADARWRTAEGIRPGMSLAAVRRIYPEARRRAGRGLVLVEPGTGARASPVLAATIGRGRVNSLVFPIRPGGG